MLCITCEVNKNKSHFDFDNICNDCLDISLIDKGDLFSFCKKRSFNLSKNSKIYSFIEDMYSFDISWKAKLYLYVNNIVEPNKCYCGNWTSFISTTKGFRVFCSTKCSRNSSQVSDKIKKTVYEKWGVDNVMKSSEVKESHKKSIFKNWGVDNISKDDVIKKRKELTMISNFGVSYNSQREIVKKSSSKRISEYNSCNNTIRHIDHWNIKLSGLGLEFISKYIGSIIEIKCPNKEHSFKIHKTTFNDRISNKTPICTICNPVDLSISHKENELFDFIKSIYSGVIIQSYRDGLEIDVYLPDLKLGFEFNGLYWHSDKYKDKNYHKNKSEFFNDKGIRIIHIWEDDWVYKRGVLESQIENLLGESERIFARNCKCLLIEDVGEVKLFLSNNHIQGFVASKLKLGLYHNDELVSIMLFDKFEGRKKMIDSEWNLSRFCNKSGFSVIGGFSKLLKFFISEYSPERIISYSDSSWSDGNVYSKSGFNLSENISPDYKYIIGDIRLNKSRFRKSNTKVSEKELDYYKIWDCGKKKWEFLLKNSNI